MRKSLPDIKSFSFPRENEDSFQRLCESTWQMIWTEKVMRWFLQSTMRLHFLIESRLKFLIKEGWRRTKYWRRCAECGVTTCNLQVDDPKTGEWVRQTPSRVSDERSKRRKWLGKSGGEEISMNSHLLHLIHLLLRNHFTGSSLLLLPSVKSSNVSVWMWLEPPFLWLDLFRL